MKSQLLIGLLLLPIIGFAQPQPIGFLSQDSLLQVYYMPKFRWADSIVHVIWRQATGHQSAEIYLQMKVLQQKNQAENKPPTLHSTAHSAVFWEEKPAKPRKSRR